MKDEASIAEITTKEVKQQLLLHHCKCHLDHIQKQGNFDDSKTILPIDLPKLSSEAYDHLTHDVSMEYLEGCSICF